MEEEEKEEELGAGRSQTGVMESFRWSSFSSSSSFAPDSFGSESFDVPPMSEYEEIPSLRWLPPSFGRRRSSPSSNRRDAAAARPAAESVDDGERLLPVDPLGISSLKRLYARPHNPIVVDQGTKIITLERRNGKKCYMLSTSVLDIAWGSGPRFLFRDPLPQSKFATTGERPMLGRFFRIAGNVDVGELSPRTVYAAYLVFKISSELFYQGSLDASITAGGHTSERTVWLEAEKMIKKRFYGSYNYETVGRQYYEKHRSVEEWMTKVHDTLVDVGEQMTSIVASKQRADGWLEVELGEFSVGDGAAAAATATERVVQVRLEDTRGVNRRAVVVEGIDLRPKSSSATADN